MRPDHPLVTACQLYSYVWEQLKFLERVGMYVIGMLCLGKFFPGSLKVMTYSLWQKCIRLHNSGQASQHHDINKKVCQFIIAFKIHVQSNKLKDLTVPLSTTAPLPSLKDISTKSGTNLLSIFTSPT